MPGRFPSKSSRGKSYILVLYNYDSNAILADPMRSRYAVKWLRAFKVLEEHLCKRGPRPKLQLLDNEVSTMLKLHLHLRGIDYQLMPPHVHRRNAAKRAIRTFKNHFLAILCGTDPDVPLHLWCRLIPQAQITLNLLRKSQINPRLSAEVGGLLRFEKTFFEK